MKRAILMVAMVFGVFPFVSQQAEATIEFKNGGTHNINYAITDNYVWVDYDAPNMETIVNILDGGVIPNSINGYQDSHINVLGGTITNLLGFNENSQAIISGGSIKKLRAWDSSNITVSGGSIDSYLYAHHNSQVNISDGSKGYLGAFQDSKVNISGGSVVGQLIVDDNSTVNIIGGTVGGILYTYLNGIIYLNGTGFAVNATPLVNGAKLSEFGTLIENGDLDYYTGTITGTLADGVDLDNTFEIYNTGTYEGIADIIIIPEPTTLLLFGLGGLALRKRK